MEKVTLTELTTKLFFTSIFEIKSFPWTSKFLFRKSEEIWKVIEFDSDFFFCFSNGLFKTWKNNMEKISKQTPLACLRATEDISKKELK